MQTRISFWGGRMIPRTSLPACGRVIAPLTVCFVVYYNARNENVRYVCFCNRDHAKALNFFATAHAATAEGHASAALHLGIMYLNGYGVEADVEKAEMLFKFALEKGEPDAEQAMELLAEKRRQLESSLDSSFSAGEGTEV
jgi:hypothetical protein